MTKEDLSPLLQGGGGAGGQPMFGSGGQYNPGY